MSCCFPKRCFNRRARREDCYTVKETAETNLDEGEAPKFSWDRKEKRDASEYTISEVHGMTLKKEGKEGGPLQIENCTEATILFLHRSTQVMIDDCRNCNIVLGPTQGSIFLRDCSNCTVLVACQQLRTRDCTSVRIGILCPTEPIVENSHDICFYHLAMKYPLLKDQIHAAGLRPFTNRVTSAHDFTPGGIDGKGNFRIFSEAVNISEGQEDILKNKGVVLKHSPGDFIPRFSDVRDDDPTFLYVLGKMQPVDELGDRAIELLHAIYAADMKVMATFDLETKTVDPKIVPFAGNSERIIIFQLSGSLAKLECDVEFDIISENDLEPMKKLIIHMKGKNKE